MTEADLTGAERLLREVVAGHFLPGPPERIGVAVSGGSDSTALLLLLSDFASEAGVRLHVVTVDHGLRPEAAAEARGVAALAADLGHSHDTLRWTGWDGQGNLQDAARRARFDLMAEWAAERGIGTVALGHTADDQAETILMRLARAAGADGLSGMPVQRRHRCITFLRPMLGLRRCDLRAMLRRRGQAWVEDPSNTDTSYERVRARQALAHLQPLGLTVPTLAAVASNSAAIRDTLDWYAFTEARACVRIEGGDVVIPLRDLRRLRPEILRRILVAALHWLTGAEYPPRRRAMELLAESVRHGSDMTLHGCHAMVKAGDLRLMREAKAAADASAAPGELWDGRWRLTPPPGRGVPKNAEIRALGSAGLAECPAWRETRRPRASLVASPAVWCGEALIAAPLAGRGDGWSARLVRGEEDFFGAFLSH
ncbi:tRNA lysidine(34) synthetase TilS [Pseudooceanicola sp.]|uniref:tRNA lysidine(34) synthetase TilS n=1 Tax=Pseudooceanicola sp. TaxID=1914328 RepID=UPI0040586DBA